MELTLPQQQLAKALSAVGRIATNRAGLPVLNNILLKTDGARLVAAATNLEVASTYGTPAKIVKHGDITVPARLVADFVTNLPKKDVTITTKSNKLTITCAGYTSTINGISAQEFPELPTIEEETSIHYSIRVDDFKKAVGQTILACSNDAARPVLTGVYWHSCEGYLYLAGTDGYRLAERRLMETQSELAAIIPSSTLQEVLRLLSDEHDEVDMLFDETQVRFRIGDVEVTSRLIDGKYPDYRKLIPASTETTALVSTSELSRTNKIAALFARTSGGSVTIKLENETNTLSIASIASEVGENTSEISADVNGEGGATTLNSRYITDMLNVIDSDSLSLGFNGKLAPCVMRPTAYEGYVHIIMPLKS